MGYVTGRVTIMDFDVIGYVTVWVAISGLEFHSLCYSSGSNQWTQIS